MFNMHVVCSEDIDGEDAAHELVKKAKDKVVEHKACAMLFFTSLLNTDYQGMLEIICDAFTDIPLIGCTTDSDLSGKLLQSEDSSILIIFEADRISFAAGVVDQITAMDEGQLNDECLRIAGQLGNEIDGAEAKLCFAFPDALLTHKRPLIATMAKALNGLPLFGGTASDNQKFQCTHQFYNRQVFNDAMPVLMLGGNLKFAYGVAHGWNPVSQLSRITKSEQNIVYEIDGIPATEYYCRFLGKTLSTVPGIFSQFALTVFDPILGLSYMRDPVVPNTEKGSISFSGEVPEGSVVRLAEIGRDEAIEAVEMSTMMALKNFDNSAIEGALVFSCSSRRNLLGTRVKEECATCKEILQLEDNIAGFYGLGEIAPPDAQVQSILHNGTFVVVLLGEE